MNEAGGRSLAVRGSARARMDGGEHVEPQAVKPAADGRPAADGESPKTPVAWSEALGEAICARVAAGALLHPLCREPGMPTARAVDAWAAARPEFAQALAQARAAAGRPAGVRGQPLSYCQATAEAIFERLCGGESLTSIGRDPAMPALSTIYYWRRRVPGFEDLVREGIEIRADVFCDRGWEMAEAATPETAYLTQVRLGQLRWMAGVMKPRVYRLRPAETGSCR
jgi:hypothetical protein